MRAGASLRLNRGFQIETAILPILSFRMAIHILDHLPDGSQPVEQLFPPGEADPVIAELAITRNAYILSQDSDFFITSHGSRGYIPLDSVNFHYLPEPNEERTQTAPTAVQADDDDDNSDWAPVMKPSKSSRRLQSHQSPTPLGSSAASAKNSRPGDALSYEAVTLETLPSASLMTCKAYESQDLAASLDLSPAYLPSLAILAGNDYYSLPIWRSTKVGGSNEGKTRIEAIATALRKCVGKQAKTPTAWSEDALRSYLVKVVHELREFAMTEGQVEAVVDAALESLPVYQSSSLSTIHSSGLTTPNTVSSMPDTTPGVPSLSIFLAVPDDPLYLSKSRLLNAFETGCLRNTVMQIAATGIYAPTPVLEEPDMTSCQISCARSIRLWVYAILSETVGIHQRSGEGTVTPSSILLAEGEAKQLDGETTGDGNAGEDESASVHSAGASSQVHSVVTEYVRRGASLAEEDVLVPSVQDLLQDLLDAPFKDLTSTLSKPTKARFEVLLHATSSATDALLRTTGPHLAILPMIATLRHLTVTFQDSRTQAWTASLRRNVLAMSYILTADSGRSQSSALSTCATSPTNAQLQRGAQVVVTLGAVSMLSEVLLLVPILTPGEMLYDGRLFYSLQDLPKDELLQILVDVGVDIDAFDKLVDVMEEGLPQVEEPEPLPSRTKKNKGEKASRSDVTATSTAPAKGDKSKLDDTLHGGATTSQASSIRSRNLFHLLSAA